MKNRFLQIILFFILSILLIPIDVSAEEYLTQIQPRQWTQVQDGRRYSIAQVGVSDLLTYVFVEVEATKKLKNVNLYAAPASKIYAGKKELPLLGILDPRGNVHKFNSTYDWIWNEMPKNSKSQYCLVFSGRPNPGVTNITIKLYGVGGKNYTFSNVRIDNPLNGFKEWNPRELEATYKQYFSQNKDNFQGIYKYGDFRVALCKAGVNDWRLIYISGGNHTKFWTPTDLVAYFTSSSGSRLNNGTYIWPNKETTSCYAQMDGDNLRLYYNHTDMLFLREYPAPNKTYIDPSKPPKGDVWTGTGWAVLNNHIVTNYHVIDGARTISIKGVNGDFSRSYDASVVATDKDNDLAILRLNNATISNIPYGVSTTPVEVGQEIFVLGYPMTDTMGDEIKLTNGIISALSGFQGTQNNYQISAPIQPGNSGGPMFDSNGNVIGVVVAKHTQADLASYAIKISYLEKLMRRTIGHSLLPTNNSISTLPLTGKVREAKNYVYYIMCSDTPDYKF